MKFLPRVALLFCLLTFSMFSSPSASGQTNVFVPNYDESKVPQYTLPDPLLAMDGTAVLTAEEWESKRRPEILRLFETEVYGRTPMHDVVTRFEITSVDKKALGGKATRKEVAIHFSGNGVTQRLDLLIYLPNRVRGRVPMFLGANFYGNHTIHADPGISLSTNWMHSNAEKGIVDHQATEASRGTSASRWPLETILRKGYGLATFYYGDIVPDDAKTGLSRGIHRLFSENVSAAPDSERWGAIGAWAWGLSRVMDYLESDVKVDAKRVVVLGHSRLGKTALWAGAQDRRFAVVISNNSGCGGAALSRRAFGETVGRINTSFPHWFCGNFKKYNEQEDQLPVDQHQLLTLIAPRPLYVASAEDDLWADPLGEFLAAKHTDPVYALFGKIGLGVGAPPPVNTPVGLSVGYHIRTGKHDVTDYDWEQYLKFANRHLTTRSPFAGVYGRWKLK